MKKIFPDPSTGELTEQEEKTVKKTVWRVQCWEYERGWGRSDMGYKDFPSYNKAVEFQKDYNKDNTQASAPEQYFVADDPQAIEVHKKIRKRPHKKPPLAKDHQISELRQQMKFIILECERTANTIDWWNQNPDELEKWAKRIREMQAVGKEGTCLPAAGLRSAARAGREVLDWPDPKKALEEATKKARNKNGQ